METAYICNAVQVKRKKISANQFTSSHQMCSSIANTLPVLHSADYYMKPTLEELASREALEKGYCSRVPSFTIGRIGYGYVKFCGETDVRWLQLDEIVRFQRNEIIIYPDGSHKPPIGQGLNKPAKVTLIVRRSCPASRSVQHDNFVRLLERSAERQGSHFISFNFLESKWKFFVLHFSRFGLNEEEDDEDDVVMDDAAIPEEAKPNAIRPDSENEFLMHPSQNVLPHSLPAHLGLNPAKMQEMKMLMFHTEEDTVNSRKDATSPIKSSHRHTSFREAARKLSISDKRKSPQAMLEYSTTWPLSSPRNVLMIQQNRGLPPRAAKVEGFKLDLKRETPLTSSHSKNVVDAALFMGRSFRVGWAPNGVLVHSGKPIGSAIFEGELSSIIHVEKVDMKGVARGENAEATDALKNVCFESLLNYHRSLEHDTKDIEVGSFRLKLQKLVCSRQKLSDISKMYVDFIEKELDIPGLSITVETFLMHQVMIWELIKVLFVERKMDDHSNITEIDMNDEDMMNDGGDGPTAVDHEAHTLLRRAEFSSWLEESVYHHVQKEISFPSENNDLEQIFSLLTGRQLDSAVNLAASRGDVRMACLLSQAGGSMVNRHNMLSQFEIWKKNGMDFSFIEGERLRICQLLAGNVEDAMNDSVIDWKRYMGLIMWYQLPPETPLTVIINTYEQLLHEQRAPYPVPVYIDEGPLEGAPEWHEGERYDLAFYIMLLYANKEEAYGLLKTMFTAFASTFDPLDYHMIWHQRTLLEAIGAFTSNDLHSLDISFVTQLLYFGYCHWAIYVVLHMPHRDDWPFLQASVIWEILLQYCDCWSKSDVQRQLILDLGVPSEWLHEALGIYFEYYGNPMKAFINFLECCRWQKAHSIFMASVAHTLFHSSQHSDIWKFAISMEEHKSEIADWTLGAGIFIDFYILRRVLRGDDTINNVDSLENKNQACKDFFTNLNKSLLVWGSKLPTDARVMYSKMAEEICSLLVPCGEKNMTRVIQLSCFETMFMAPVQPDISSCHVQDAVSVFAYFLSEIDA